METRRGDGGFFHSQGEIRKHVLEQALQSSFTANITTSFLHVSTNPVYFSVLCEHLSSASSRDELKALHNGNYSAILCFRVDPLCPALVCDWLWCENHSPLSQRSDPAHNLADCGLDLTSASPPPPPPKTKQKKKNNNNNSANETEPILLPDIEWGLVRWCRINKGS